jgi:hypothetical protein
LTICEHFMSVCGINDPGHTCDEYLVLLAKSGMTPFDYIKSESFITSLVASV